MPITAVFWEAEAKRLQVQTHPGQLSDLGRPCLKFFKKNYWKGWDVA